MSVAASLRAFYAKYGKPAVDTVMDVLGPDAPPAQVKQALERTTAKTAPTTKAPAAPKTEGKTSAKRRRVAQGSRETVPGSRTGILPEVINAPFAVRQELDDRMRPAIYDEQGMDRIAQSFGLEQMPSFQAPGIFEGINPGVQVQYVVPAAGTGMTKAGMRDMDAIESTYGLLTGQTATAGNRFSPNAMGSDFEIDLGRPLNNAEAQRLLDYQSRLGLDPNSMAIVPSAAGVRIADFGANRPQLERMIEKGAREFDALDVAPGRFAGYYKENQWDQPGGQYGQEYLEALTANPKYSSAFDAVAPEIAERLRGTYRDFARENRMTMPAYFDDLLGAVAGGGEAGLRDLIRRRGFAKGGAVESQMTSDVMHLAEKYGLA